MRAFRLILPTSSGLVSQTFSASVQPGWLATSSKAASNS
jgi:hypothetical protein